MAHVTSLSLMTLSSHGPLACHDSLPTAHGCRVVFVTALALLAATLGVLGVGNLGACGGTNVDALAEGVVDLEARRALLVGQA